MATRKKTTKKRAKKATTKKGPRKRRTPAQKAATKRLVASNKARAKGRTPKIRRKSQAYWTKWAAKQPEKRDVEGRLMFQGPMTPSQDAAMRRAMKVMGLRSAEMYQGPSGELVVQAPMTARQAQKGRRRRPILQGKKRGFVGPLPPGEHAAALAFAREMKGAKGARFQDLQQDYFKSKLKRRAKTASARAVAKIESLVKKGKQPTTATGILKKAQKEAKYSRLRPILKGFPKTGAAWVCGNRQGFRTGCGGGKKKLRGSRVIGILQ